MANLCRMRVPKTGGRLDEGYSAEKRPKPDDLADLLPVKKGTVLFSFFPPQSAWKQQFWKKNKKEKKTCTCVLASPSWSIWPLARSLVLPLPHLPHMVESLEPSAVLHVPPLLHYVNLWATASMLGRECSPAGRPAASWHCATINMCGGTCSALEGKEG